MLYVLWLAVSLTGDPGTWRHYPIDGWESMRECQDARATIESNFTKSYGEEPGKTWTLYCRAQGKV